MLRSPISTSPFHDVAVSEQIVPLIVAITAVLALCAAVATLVWFIADQFKKTRAEFWKGIAELHNSFITQLEAHKDSNSAEFKSVHDELWGLKMRNAERDGRPYPHRLAPDGS